MKLSVIIPAFNEERYISRAIDSVFQQTQKNIELIVVDDGSIDNTAEIVKSYGAKVKYYYQQNKGVAAARNFGIENSNGSFIAFLDADDYVLPKMYEKLLIEAQCTNSDIVLCNIYFENRNGLRIKAFNYQECQLDLNKPKYLDKAFRIIGDSCCNKIYRRSLVQGIRFPELNLGEDGLFVLECLLKAKEIYCLNEPLYVYFQNPISITKSGVNYKIIEIYGQFQSRKRELISKYNCIGILNNALQNYYIKSFLIYANSIRQIKDTKERYLCWGKWLIINRDDYLNRTSLSIIIAVSTNIHWVYYVGMIVTCAFIDPLLKRIRNSKYYLADS